MIGKTKMISENELTREQRECVNYSGDDLLVKGIAGSGKTLVLLHRAIKLKKNAEKENKSIKIGFFTYANTLIQYANELIAGLGEDSNFLNITTFHSYAGKLLRNYTNSRNKVIDYDKNIKKEDLISNAINNQISIKGRNHRLYDLDNKFWIEEFDWIKGKYIKNPEDYVNAERIGRGSGVRMSRNDKKIAFDLYEEYIKVLKSKGYIDLNDFSNILNDEFHRIPIEAKFDYVFVDEAQDLSYSQLLLLRNLANKGLVVAADHAQKIYKNTFTWREIGINVRGNASKSLRKSFRSTKQIMELAYSLLSNNKSSRGRDTEYILPDLPNEEGPLPELVMCNAIYEEDSVLRTLIERYKKSNNLTIGLLYRTWKEKSLIEKILRSISASYEVITRNKEWSLLNPGLKVVSLHSAKGLEFDIVIIPRLNQGIIPVNPETNDIEDIDDFLEVERSLLYVGMTRAKKSLFMLSSGEKSQFIDEFDKSYYELTTI